MRYVIIGNGVAGITAAFTLRAREHDAAITVIGGESDYFFSRTGLMYAFMDRLAVRDLEPYERKTYNRQRIERVRDWVCGLDAEAHSLTLRGGRQVRYDRLLLATGSLPNRPNWPGLDSVREGVVHFVTLQDLEHCERLTRLGANAVVVGGGLIGVELVECLKHHGMNVTFLVREPWYWPAALGEPEGQMITRHLRSHGINVVHDELVAGVEADASGIVCALRTESGARFECAMLGVTTGVHPAVEWLQSIGGAPMVRRGIVVDSGFRTSLRDVWAAGDCAEIQSGAGEPLIEQIWYSAKRQGELAARSMLGDDVAYSRPVFYNSAKFFEIEYTTVGRFGGREFYARVPGKNVSIRISESGGAVQGFNMLGSRWEHTLFEKWIAESRGLDYVLDHLHEAQFDVEFGRQDLSALRAPQAAATVKA